MVAPPPRRAVWLLAWACLAAGCAPATTVVGSAQRVVVPDAAPGSVNAALLRFDLDAGTAAPQLTRANGYQPPATAIYVAGVAPDPSLPNGYVGMVAIVDLKGPGQQRQRRTGAVVTASQDFGIEFSGNATYASNEVAGYQGLGQHGAWAVSWDSGPATVPFVAADGARLLDEVAAQLRGTTSPALLAALGGQPQPPIQVAGPGAAPAWGGTPGAGSRRSTTSAPAAGQGNATVATGSSSAAGTAGAGGPNPSPVDTASPSPSPSPPAPPRPGGPPPGPTPTPSPTPTPTPSPTPTPTAPGITATVATVRRSPVAVAPGGEVSVTTGCPQATVMTGGGAITASSGSPMMLASTMPVGAGGAPSGNWSVGSTPAGPAVTDSATEEFIVCLINGPTTNVIVAATATGPTAGAAVTATATCPAGTVLTGGGGSVPPASAPSVTLTASYPSTPQGDVVTSGSASSWSAVGSAAPAGGAGSTTSAFAICVAPGTMNAPVVVAATAPAVGAFAVATVTCPAGTLPLAGGFLLGGGPSPDAYVPQTYPSDGGANAVVNAGDSTSWTSVAVADGASSSAPFTAFALCV